LRHLRLLTLLCLTSVPVFAAACSAPTTADETTDEATSDLVQFPAAAFAAAPVLTYGATSAPIAVPSGGGWGVIRWKGTANDEFIATVTATTADRTPRAYLVEKRADGKYVAILSGTSSVDGLVRAKLANTQEYFIVFREYSRRIATFTVKLEQAGSLPAACSGTPLLEQGIIDRTPQAENPALNATGVYETSVRRCNVATGCADPVKQSNPNAAMSMQKRASDGKWIISSPFSAEHDGTTGALTGTANVTADDGRSIPVALTGAATTGCVSVSGGGRSTIDPITYYDVQVTYRATTPPVAARTPQPATPPPTECDPEALITDEELLSRFPRGSASVVLGQAYINEDQQYCHPQTGCRPWARSQANINGGARYVQATAVVLGASSLGVKFYNSYNGNIATTMAVEDGTLAVTSDLLIRGNVANTSTVSDTHLQVKETNVFVSGDYKYRRYVCIPIPPHP
jgi:hypothetical protein